MSSPALKLNNGLEMPILGLGTYKSKPGEVTQAVKDAIDVGYRHLDCAYMYENEREIGIAIQDKIKDGTVQREELFITTKLWNTFHSKEKVIPALKESLKNLSLEYVDLYLMHWPYGFKEGGDLTPKVDGKIQFSDVDYLETWQALEECVDLGLTKSIGVSNFNSEQIDRIIKNCRIKPVNNQVECNPNLNQKKLIQFCKEQDVTITGYSPLGRPNVTLGVEGKPQPNTEDSKVIEMGKKYGKTPAQIVLKYLISLGISVIPKSVTKSRIIDNINIFDFELTPEEIGYMDTLNKNVRLVPALDCKDHKYYPFNIEF